MFVVLNIFVDVKNSLTTFLHIQSFLLFYYQENDRMILLDEQLSKGGLKMVKSRRELGTPRRRNSLVKNSKIIKNTARPISAASSVPAVPAANIRVVVRVRPVNSREQGENSRYNLVLLCQYFYSYTF